MRLHSQGRSRRAFSLVEVILALGVFSLAMASFMGMLGALLNGVRSVSDRDEAIGLTTTLEDALQGASIDDVYRWVSPSNPDTLYAYHYRAQITAGSAGDPAIASGDVSNYTLIPALRVSGNSRLDAELNAREGALYRVILRVSNANPIKANNLPAAAADYTESVLAVSANFYAVTQKGASVNTNLPPAHSITLAFRR